MRSLALWTLAACAFGSAACSTSSDNGADAPTSGGCTRASDCQVGFSCIAGVCGSPGTLNQGATCWATRDCMSSLYCTTAGRCATAGTGSGGAGCVSDADCSAGLRCDIEGFVGSCSASGTADVQASCSVQSDCIAGLFCGANGTCQLYPTAFPSFQGVNCPKDTSAFHSYFVVPRAAAPLADFFRLPYPNDIRVTAQKTLDLTGFADPGRSILGFDIVKLYNDALSASFDGFSIFTPTVFRFNADVHFPSVGDAIHYVDLDTGRDLGAQFLYNSEATKLSCGFYLSFSPNTTPSVLPPGHTFAVYLTTALTSESSQTAATADPDLVATLGATKPGDADLGHAWDTYAKLRAYLTTNNIAATTIVNAAVFTTADPAAHMQHVAAAVASEPSPPVLSSLFQCGGAGTDACDDGTAARKCGTDSADFVEIHGKMAMPIYQNGTEPYETAGGALNETAGVVTKVRSEDVCFAMTLPKTTLPTAGWPLVVYGHGTGGSFREVITSGISDTLAKKGIATFSFDAFGHGARRGTSKQAPSVLVFNVANPPAARDGWLQGGADVLTALKLPRSATPSGWTGPTLKFDKVVYFGHSQGATAGELALPFTEDTHAIVLSGAGAGLTNSLIGKRSPSNVQAELQLVFNDFVQNSDYPVFLIWQNYFDRSDPLSTNPLLIQNPPTGKTAKNVFMTMAQSDTFAPEVTLEINAAGLGVGKAPPVLFDFGTPGGTATRPVSKNFDGVFAAAFQYAPSGYDGHFVAQQNADAVKDWTAFITLYFASGTPSVP